MTQRAGPVRHGEGVFGLGAWFGVAIEKAKDESVGLGGEDIDSDLPAEIPSQAPNEVPEEGGADRPGNFKGA